MFNTVYSGKLSDIKNEFEKKSNATPEAIKQAQDVNKALEGLNQTVNSLGNNLVLAFGPAVSTLLQDFGDWVPGLWCSIDDQSECHRHQGRG